tara:strand:+ start:5142 stop:5951 length:810 start_codon:yes stop_codon:yes gene_type:complete
MTIDVRMPGANSTTAGNTAIFKLPTGRRYHDLQIEFSGITLAQMTEIRVLANGKPIHRYTGAMRNVLNKFDGRQDASVSNVLVIPFTRYKLKNRQAEEETALNTGSDQAIRSLTLEIDMHADAAATEFKMNATQSDNVDELTPILHCLYYPRSTAGAGEAQFGDLPFGKLTSQALNRVFIKPDSGTVEKVVIERDTYTIFERSKGLNDSIQKDGVRVAQSGYYVIDRTEKGYGGDPIALAGAQDYRYRVEFTEAAQVDFQIEYIGGLGD